jgi:hypothetical protein
MNDLNKLVSRAVLEILEDLEEFDEDINCPLPEVIKNIFLYALKDIGLLSLNIDAPLCKEFLRIAVSSTMKLIDYDEIAREISPKLEVTILAKEGVKVISVKEVIKKTKETKNAKRHNDSKGDKRLSTFTYL